jgi:hypothetical protein
MKAASVKPVRCAIYTRVSTEHGLDQEFNSLDAQYDAASAYIKSQAHAGWTLIRSRYDDGGYSGGSTDRPDLQKLLDDIRARKIDVIVVYKVDRLTRSLADFAKLVELFDAHGVSIVSVAQQFNTTFRTLPPPDPASVSGLFRQNKKETWLLVRRTRVARGNMAELSQFSIVTYERRPGHWRAAITPYAASWTASAARLRACSATTAH